MTGRRNRCVFWFVCGILVVCLAGIELPELLTLTNDTSNDFTTSLVSSKAASAVPIHSADSQQRNAGRSVLHRAYAYYCFPTTFNPTSWQSPRDLLALHSLWRT